MHPFDPVTSHHNDSTDSTDPASEMTSSARAAEHAIQHLCQIHVDPTEHDAG